MQPEEVLRIAEDEIGVKEIPGDGDNPRILEYHACTSLKATEDSVPWCSSFVNWVVCQAGGSGTNSAAALSWLYWGVPVDDPSPGCIVVLKRGRTPSPAEIYEGHRTGHYPTGHVGIFKYRKSPGGWVWILGGNQSDQVNMSAYQEADVLGYRWIENKEEANEKDI